MPKQAKYHSLPAYRLLLDLKESAPKAVLLGSKLFQPMLQEI
jgi:hypothetical protein